MSPGVTLKSIKQLKQVCPKKKQSLVDCTMSNTILGNPFPYTTYVLVDMSQHVRYHK